MERLLYQFTLSPYCIKVRRILEYKGIPFRTVEVNPFARGEVMRLSGQKRVPVLVERGEGGGPDVVTADSTAIAERLDRLHPEPRLYPEDTAARGRVALLEDWSDETFATDLIAFKIFTPGNGRLMVEQSKRFYEPRWYYELLFPLGPALLRLLAWPRRRGRSLDRVRLDYERDLDFLEAVAAGGPYLAGESPTVFDFAVWGLLRTMEGLDGEELLARRPRLAAWYARVKALPPASPV